VFYGLGSPAFVPLLVVSIIANYAIGARILAHNRIGVEAGSAKRWLIFGVGVNLAALAYFKYTNFFLDNVSAMSNWEAQWPRIVLPVGISFFTFTQIAFLVDCRRGGAHRYRFWDYLLFVSFFPHLVAGPILNHKSVLPQIETREFGRPGAREIYTALIFFSIGLFKKTIIADSLAPHVQTVFNAIPQLAFVDAWVGALLYTFQLYYDFSGYSEMAVGLALLINIRIPINFDSPYKSTSIVEFWRRWHISLSNFLRDYLYIPLGGNRLGTRRRYANLLATMVLGGLWHGAGWTFLAWGTLHGMGLAINHAWRGAGLRLPTAIAWPLTFLFVVIAWVFFRSPDFGSALSMLATMAGLHGLPPLSEFISGRAFFPLTLQPVSLVWVAALALWVAVAPNTQEIALADRPRPAFAVACGFLFAAAVLGLDQASEFLYFQF
jgi:alginate O-acetyltransferase complex protein AlgI